MDALKRGAPPHSNTDGNRSRLSGQLWEAHKARTWSDGTPNNLQLGQGVDNGSRRPCPERHLSRRVCDSKSIDLRRIIFMPRLREAPLMPSSGSLGATYENLVPNDCGTIDTVPSSQWELELRRSRQSAGKFSLETRTRRTAHCYLGVNASSLAVTERIEQMALIFESYAQSLRTARRPRFQLTPREQSRATDMHRRRPWRSQLRCRPLLSGTLWCAFGHIACRDRPWTRRSCYMPRTMPRMACTRLMWTRTMRVARWWASAWVLSISLVCSLQESRGGPTCV